jgi:hypothetical protein
MQRKNNSGNLCKVALNNFEFSFASETAAEVITREEEELVSKTL